MAIRTRAEPVRSTRVDARRIRAGGVAGPDINGDAIGPGSLPGVGHGERLATGCVARNMGRKWGLHTWCFERGCSGQYRGERGWSPAVERDQQGRFYRCQHDAGC